MPNNVDDLCQTILKVTRWEQAFSYDDRTWETNWTADFERADPDKVCDSGRPKR